MKRYLHKYFTCTLALCVVVTTSSFSAHTPNPASSSQETNAVMPAPNYKELILQFDAVNEKNYMDIRNSIQADGVYFKGYCPALRILMYLVDRDVQPGNGFLDKLAIKGYSYQVKEGSIAQVKTACGMDTGNTPAETE